MDSSKIGLNGISGLTCSMARGFGFGFGFGLSVGAAGLLDGRAGLAVVGFGGGGPCG